MKPPTSHTLVQLRCGDCKEPMTCLGDSDAYCSNYHCGQFMVEWHREDSIDFSKSNPDPESDVKFEVVDLWAPVLQTPPLDNRNY